MKTSIRVDLEACPGDKVFVLKDNRLRSGTVKEVVATVRRGEGELKELLGVDQQLLVVIETPGFRYVETRYPREIGATIEELFEKLDRARKEGY